MCFFLVYFEYLCLGCFAADYASVVAFELWKTQGQYNVTMKFKNGTNDDQFRQLKMWGHDSLSLAQLENDLFVRS